MSGRGGLPVRNFVYGIFLILLVYMVYIYNGSQTRLRDAEMNGARYKREVEEHVSEIQGLIKEKDRLQEKFNKEKDVVQTSLKSVNQQNSMLQSRVKEIEADNQKMKEELDLKDKTHADAENQYAQEYQTMKQEKDNEIARLKDEVADLKRRNSELETSIASLRDQNKIDETARQNLLDENYLLKKQVQQKPGAAQDHDQQGAAQLGTGDALKLHAGDANGFVPNLDNQQGTKGKDAIDNMVHNMKIDEMDKIKNDVHADSLDGELDKIQPKVGEPNGIHQVQPPNNFIEGDIEEKKDGDLDRPAVNPNDEQKAQILEPMLGDKLDGGEDGVDQMHARVEEAEREEAVKKEEESDVAGNGLEQHQNPLALGQIADPGVDREGFGHDEDSIGQQLPPLNKKEDDTNVDGQYFNQDDDQRQQDAKDDLGLQNEEEEEEEEADDGGAVDNFNENENEDDNHVLGNERNEGEGLHYRDEQYEGN